MTPRVEVKGLDKLVGALEQAPGWIRDGFDRAVGEAAEKIRSTAAGLIHSRTGRLAKSLYVAHPGLVSYSVESIVPYALFVHEGTRPHMIYPRRAGGVLAFEAGGTTVFTRYVHHPGTMPQNFLSGALEYHRAEFMQVVKERVREWIRWSDAQ